MMRRRRHHQDGFSLLEVVVAFAIAAMALAVLSRIFGQGARHLALAKDYTEAMVLSDSLLAEYGNMKDPATRSYADSTGRFRWVVAVRPYLIADDPPIPDSPAASRSQLIGTGRESPALSA